MATNEAGLSGGKDQGDGGSIKASDMPGGEQNAGPNEGGASEETTDAVAANEGETRSDLGREGSDPSPGEAA
jgi:hypothetical protein